MAIGKRVEPNVPSSLPGTSSHFFKVMVPSTLKDEKMRIPQKFVEKFGHELSDVATLIVPNGSCWRVNLFKDGRHVWFCDGWHEFVESHSISSGYFLTFKYGKNSSFHVIIFDLTTCEINYPCKYEESENVKWNSEFQVDMEREDSEQLIGTATPKQPLSSLKNKNFDECSKKRVFSKRNSVSAPRNQAKDACSSSWRFRRNCPVLPPQNQVTDAFDFSQRIRRNCPAAVPLENSKVKRKYESQSKKSKMEEFVEIIELDDGNENDWCSSLGEMGIYFTQRHRSFSAEENQRAFNIARSLKLKNPSFMVILRPMNILHGCLYVPGEFANKYLNRNDKYIKLQASKGRELSIKVYWRHKGGFYLRRGWVEFSEAKNLKKGDICIFELMRRKDVLLKFSVFQCEREGVCSKRNSPRAHRNQAKDTFGSAQRFKRKCQPVIFLENSKIKHNYDYEPQSKKCKIESMEVNESDGDNEYDFFAILGELGICVSKKFVLLSTEESKRAINAARSLSPKCPSFMVILRSSNIDCYFLHVPANFANKFLSRDAKFIRLQYSNDREYWSIQIRRAPYGRLLLTKGWAEVLKEKNLKQGDICIFELIRVKDILLKLSVFHG